jgi:uncharacterized protein
MKAGKTKYYSYKAGVLADGCKKCVRGEKLVLFVTGLCSQRCLFCPVSDRKLYQDVVYANERPLKNSDDVKDIIAEAEVSLATGAGITGGDPLMKLERTVSYIKLLKKHFGKKFHIHLYTPLNLVTLQRLNALNNAGLDEIRFHPELGRKNQWERILLARNYSWQVGVEVPMIPGKKEELKELVDFIDGKVDFLNLNELELADNKVWRNTKGIVTRDHLSYAIKGSDELARELLRYSAKKGIRTHYCTCKLKDRVQLARRVYRRGKNIRRITDRMTNEGMLVRGAIYSSDLKPGFSYHRRILELNTVDKEKILKMLNHARLMISKREKVSKNLLFVDCDKPRILTSENVVRMIGDVAGMTRAVVVEYPTFDALELEVEFL